MKKISFLISTCIIAFTFSMCNQKTESHSHDTDTKDSSNTMATDESPKETDACKTISADDSTKYISKKVTVKGAVENELVLTVDSLKQMKVETIENFVVVCQSGANMKQDKTCKGVLLRDILEKAKIKQTNHKDRNFYIVARATDNYKATFSWAEIFNNPTGDNIYILFEENGQPIQKQGDMILICKNDIKTGPRHVYWLSSIEVNRVD